MSSLPLGPSDLWWSARGGLQGLLQDVSKVGVSNEGLILQGPRFYGVGMQRSL